MKTLLILSTLFFVSCTTAGNIATIAQNKVAPYSIYLSGELRGQFSTNSRYIYFEAFAEGKLQFWGPTSDGGEPELLRSIELEAVDYARAWRVDFAQRPGQPFASIVQVPLIEAVVELPGVTVVGPLSPSL